MPRELLTMFESAPFPSGGEVPHNTLRTAHRGSFKRGVHDRNLQTGSYKQGHGDELKRHMRFFNIQRQIHQAIRIGQPGRRAFARSALVAFAALMPSTVLAREEHRPQHVIPRQVDWIVEAGDSICGVLEARQIRKPAKVAFDRLVSITPEGKKIRRERIDPESAKGIRLMNRATSRIRDASAVVMRRQGYDSVWKRISSRKGAHILDVTAYVELEIENSPRLGAPLGL